MAQEIASAHIKHNLDINEDVAVRIKKGNFYWGREIKDEQNDSKQQASKKESNSDDDSKEGK